MTFSRRRPQTASFLFPLKISSYPSTPSLSHRTVYTLYAALPPETVTALQVYLRHRCPQQPAIQQLFLNANGGALTRFGIRYLTRKYGSRAQATQPSLQLKPVNPHTLRHTTAMHLLRSGNDINMVSYWLGHADLNTTHIYLEIDMETKRKMLAKTEAPSIRRQADWHQPHVLKWLDQLTKSSELCAVNNPSNPRQRTRVVFNST